MTSNTFQSDINFKKQFFFPPKHITTSTYLSNQELSNLINRKIELNGYLGRVKYCGKLIHKEDKDIWLGIEWDDVNRGKHNGTVDGCYYFECENKEKNGGSLVKLSKVNVGYTLKEAIDFKYNFEEKADEKSKFINDANEKSNQFILKNKIINVELVGKEKANNKFSDIINIQCVDLSYARVNSIDKSIGGELMNIKEMILVNCLIDRWSDVIEMIIHLKSLEFLDFSDNKMRYDDDFQIKANEFNESIKIKGYLNMKRLILNRNQLKSKDLFNLSFLLNRVESLYLYGNDIYEISCCSNNFPSKIDFSKMKELSLEANGLYRLEGESTVEDLLSSFNAVNLLCLNINNNNLCDISKINFRYTNIVKTLEVLMIDGNEILENNENIISIHKEDMLKTQVKMNIFQTIQIFSNLKNLYILNNPYFINIGVEKSFKEIIGRFLNLKILNNNIILRAERKEYEVYFLKRIANEYISKACITKFSQFDNSNYEQYINSYYPTYYSLRKKHFDPLEDIIYNLKYDEDKMKEEENKAMVITTSSSSSPILKISFNYNGKIINKNIPKSTNFITIRMLVSKLYKVEDFHFFVLFNGFETKIFDEGKSLEGYDICNGSMIYLK